MLENGYIKLHRSLLRWEWYQDVNTLRVFIHLLLTVNFEDYKWKGKVIKRGQRVVSYKILADELKLSIQNIRTAINHLILTGEVTNKTSRNNSIITVINYNSYQSLTDEPTNNQQTTNKQLTNSQQTGNNNGRKIKKAKNDKNIKKESNKEKSFDDLINEYTCNDSLRCELKEHLKVRKSKKGTMTNRAIILSLQDLDKLTDNDIDKISIVQKSIKSGWIGFFPLKADADTKASVKKGPLNNFKQELPDFDAIMDKTLKRQEGGIE